MALDYVTFDCLEARTSLLYALNGHSVSEMTAINMGMLTQDNSWIHFLICYLISSNDNYHN